MELINKKVVIIDYYKSSNMPVHAFYQHDNNQLEFVIEENGTAADLSNVSRVLVNIKRPDGKVISRELDRDENVILYKMQHEEMKVSGHAVLTLQFYNEDGDRLSTAKITIYIASTVEANVEFKDKQGTLYQQIIMEMDGLKDQLYTLNRLTEEKGETAESKGKFAEEKAQEAIEAAELAAEEAANLSQLKTDVTGATEAASAAAEAARTNADHAKTQGDYAKEQADVAAQRTEELNGLEVSQFYDRQEEFSRQLAETAKKSEIQSLVTNKADKSYVENLTQSLASGSPKGTYATVSALQTAYPTGNNNTYIVTADGKWYYWNGTAWTPGGLYQSTTLNEIPATNRINNSNFLGATGWNVINATAVTADNVITVTGNGTNASPSIIQNVGARNTAHKYYSKISMRAITEGVTALQLANSLNTTVQNPTLNTWYEIDSIAQSTAYQYFAVYFKAADAASALDKKVEIKKAIEINLTETFGAGNEPTIEEIRDLLRKYPSNWFEGTAGLFPGEKVYLDIKSLKTKKISEDDLLDGSVTSKKIQNNSLSLDKLTITQKSKNLFSGKYEKYQLWGPLNNPEMLIDENSRTAVIPIEPNESYSVGVYGEKDAFRVATSVGPPDFSAASKVFKPNNFLIYNDVGRQFSFTNNSTNKYLYIKVSSKGQEPLMQVEKGLVNTEYVPHKLISESVIPKKEPEDILLPKFTNTELIPIPLDPRFIDYIDGKMWGYRHDGGFYYSTDEGRTWTPHTITWNHASWGWAERLVPTSDGEMIAVSEKHLRKSRGWNTGTVTWSENKVVPQDGCVFPLFGFDGDGTKFIVIEYGQSRPNWPNSRYVHVSTDSGETFRKVWDSLERHGEEVNALTHLHASCYDRWADRFYFSEGHSPGGGLYYSEDDGATWKQAPGHRDGVLESQGVVAKPNDTNGPTVIVATDEGLVMGSDHQNNGVFGMLRKDNPEDEKVEWVYQTHYEQKGVQMFAQRGWRDPDTGTVYITFRTESNDVPPIIVAATPRKGKLAYEYPNLPVQGQSDRFMAIAKPSPDRVVVNAFFNNNVYIFRGDVIYPNSEITNLIKIELKKLGLI